MRARQHAYDCIVYVCVYVFRVRILLALLRQFGRDHELESSYNITVYI